VIDALKPLVGEEVSIDWGVSTPAEGFGCREFNKETNLAGG